MIYFLFTFLFAQPHTMFINGQPMKEWAPIVYDIDSRTLVINDFICDPWLPYFKQEQEQEQDKILKANVLSIFFKKTGRFYPLNFLQYNPDSLTWIITSPYSLQCNQLTIFKDGFE